MNHRHVIRIAFSALAIAVFFAPLEAHTEPSSSNIPPSPLGIHTLPPPTQPHWFTVGEELTYRIYWGFIPVGNARITSGWIQAEGQPLLAIRFTMKSYRIIDAIYPVDNLMESVIDPVSFRPLKFKKILREGRNRYEELFTFNYLDGSFLWQDLLAGKTAEYSMPPEARDLVSFLMLARSYPMSPGDTITAKITDYNGVNDLKIEVGDYETIKVPALGKVSCVTATASSSSDALFQNKIPDTIWITHDGLRVIAQMVARAPIGKVKVVLIEISEPGKTGENNGEAP